MSASLTTVNSILKEFYASKIYEQLNQQTLLLNRVFQKAKLAWAGRYVVVPVHLSRNSGVGFTGDGGTLPTAGQQGFNQYQVHAKFLYGIMQITGPTLALGTNAIGIASALDAEREGLVRDVSKTTNQSLYFGGRVIGYIWEKKNEVGAANWEYSGNPSVADPAGNIVPVGAGELVDVVRADTFATVAAGVQVNSITVTPGSSATSVVNLNALDTSAVPAGVVLALVHQNAAMPERVTGIQGNLSDPDQFGINRALAANARLRGNVRKADPTTDNFAAFDPDDLQSLCDDIAENSGMYPDLIACSPRMRRQYTATLIGASQANYRVDVAQKNKQGDAGVAADGKLSFNGIEIMADPDAPLGSFFALTSDTWKWAEAQKGQFQPGTNGVLFQSPTTDTWNARFAMFAEAFCDRPNANGILTAVQY